MQEEISHMIEVHSVDRNASVCWRYRDPLWQHMEGDISYLEVVQIAAFDSNVMLHRDRISAGSRVNQRIFQSRFYSDDSLGFVAFYPLAILD